MSHSERLEKALLPLIKIFTVALVVLWVAGLFGYGMDDSDASATNHGGLRLHTDHLTGCQYFQAQNGGLLQRLDRDGRHICTTKGQP
jgi:hypothetical protein